MQIEKPDPDRNPDPHQSKKQEILRLQIDVLDPDSIGSLDPGPDPEGQKPLNIKA
jgi:hypothetical protein